MIRLAREPIPYGSPVEANAEHCWPTADLARMSGIAARSGALERGYVEGEQVEIRTEGGIRTQLLADTSLVLDGIERRLLMNEPHYFELRGGRIVR